VTGKPVVHPAEVLGLHHLKGERSCNEHHPLLRNKDMARTITRLLSAFALIAIAPQVLAEELICEYPHSVGYCDQGRYEMRMLNDSGPEIFCNGEAGRKCIQKNRGVAPSPAWINCTPVTAYTVSCSVFPKGDMHYSWSTSPQLYPSNPPNWSGSSQPIHCHQPHGSGTVTVIITTPDGESGSATTGIQCGSMVQ
jgi:hypothetical protein